MNRKDYNKLILDKLSILIEKHPYLRFTQLLVDCGVLQYKGETILDPFNEESKITWERIKNTKVYGSND